MLFERARAVNSKRIAGMIGNGDNAIASANGRISAIRELTP